MLERMMKNMKITSLKLSNRKESAEKVNRMRQSNEVKNNNQIPKDISPLNGSRILHSNGPLSTKNADRKRNFSTRNAKPFHDNDSQYKRRSLSKNNSKVKNYVQQSTIPKKEKSRCNENLSSLTSKTDIYRKVNKLNSLHSKDEIIKNDLEKKESSNSQKSEDGVNTKRVEEKNSCPNANTDAVIPNIPASTKNSTTNNVDMISISTLLSQHNNIPISLSNLKQQFDQYEPAKHSLKSLQNIRSYSANTHQGIIRNYNEDRVSIILNILKPTSHKSNFWPKCSFFAIYDGHGGSVCADYLRDNLHHFIIKDSHFPSDPVEAIKKGFDACEKEFINKMALNEAGEVTDRSGSCGLICMIISDIVYVANVGDSRALMSCNGGETVLPITIDHKPNEDNESKRIVNYGGRIYQTQTMTKNLNIPHLNINNNSNQILTGPYRVFPGRLSVSRTFGDVEAKVPKLGGIENVIISHPDIFTFKISQNMDFIVLGCDGVFDQLTDKEVSDCIWMTFNNSTKAKNIHSQSGLAVDMVLKSSLCRRTLDNVTCVLICFDNFEKIYNNAKNFVEKTPKLTTLNYNSTETTNHETNTPKLHKTDTSYSKDSYSTNKERDSIYTPKNIPISAKNNKKNEHLMENNRDNSTKKKMPSLESITTSFFKNDTKYSKIYKKMNSDLDPVKQKVYMNKNKINKNEYQTAFVTTKSISRVSSEDKKISQVKKETNLRKSNLSNMSNQTNKSLEKICFKRVNRLDFSENFSDSKFLDLKKKFGIKNNENINTNCKVKNKHY